MSLASAEPLPMLLRRPRTTTSSLGAPPGSVQAAWRRPLGQQRLCRLRVLADPVDYEDRDKDIITKAMRMPPRHVPLVGTAAAAALPPAELLKHSSLKVTFKTTEPPAAATQLPGIALSSLHERAGSPLLQPQLLDGPGSSSSSSSSGNSSNSSGSSESLQQPEQLQQRHADLHQGAQASWHGDDAAQQAALQSRIQRLSASTSSSPSPPPVAEAGGLPEAPVAQGAHDGSHHAAATDTARASTLGPGSGKDPAGPIEKEHVPGIPRPILIISLVSASLTMASCVFNTLLPIYMVTELKMTMRSMGMFEGLLEAFSYIVRMFSGIVSDMMTSRKSAITLGFAMGAMAKFGMSGATEIGSLFASKAVDRLANGVQAAPRDAMISDLAPETSRGSCFGFAQSMRKWGSAVGAVMVYFLMKASGNNYQLIFTMAATLSLASCAAFVMLVPSHARPQQSQASVSISSSDGEAGAASAPVRGAGGHVAQLCRDVAGMGSDFYRMLLIVSLYGMGHISEALLESRAMEVGFGKAESTLVVASLAFVIFVVAYPLGRLDDRFGPRVTFAVGMAALVAGNLTLLLSATQPWAVFASLLFMGVHMGVIQGPLLSIVVGLAPSNLRGTAFGIFYTVMAMTAVGANSLFGTLWHSFGACSAFGASAAMTSVTLMALPWLLPESMRQPKQLATPALS